MHPLQSVLFSCCIVMSPFFLLHHYLSILLVIILILLLHFLGSKKSAAMSVFNAAVERLHIQHETCNSESQHDDLSGPSNPPYMINSIFTMPGLSAKIDQNAGNFLLMYDEMSLLFKNIDRDSKDSPMRQVFLSLNNGSAITRSTRTSGEEAILRTHVNFCGKLCLITDLSIKV